MTENYYLPEGMLIDKPENIDALQSLASLEKAMLQGRILESTALMCNSALSLTLDLGGIRGIIPREEALLCRDGEGIKDIAIISRVGKPVCFKILSITRDTMGNPTAVLSRRAAQVECLDSYLSGLIPGDIIPARVTHLEPFGAFVDIGCGIVSLMSIDCISVSRISHPKDRFSPGDYIRVIIKSIEGDLGRIYVSHKELLGTWEENASEFSVGQTVSGIVRSIEDYGIFVELTPNLAGLAEKRDGVEVGQYSAVYIKNIIPERMKIKLVLIDSFKGSSGIVSHGYYIPQKVKHLDFWQYSPQSCPKIIESVF
ncbi:MAG: 30S ribosomal protein S1 [Ruminococcaceae bacterium]|nr:30S ribosomal protein S1 [Oscillospiraceae bacterium]